jgi:RNA polymerase primary sigma factor
MPTDENVGEVVESLIGDFDRKGRITAGDVARIATRRECDPDQINTVIRALAGRGIRIEDDGPTVVPNGGDGHASDLLSPEEEVRLARTIQAGHRLREQFGETGEPIPVESAGLIRSADQARRRFIEANRRLVEWVVNDYRWSRMDREDLVQEGVTGLMRAVEKFDPDLGVKFSTYAFWWVHQAIGRAIDNTGDVIRVPVHRLLQLRKLRRTERLLSAELGHSPSVDRLAAALEWDREFTLFMLQLSRMSTIDLDAPVTADGETFLRDMLADDSTPNPEQSAILDDLQRVIEAALGDLEPREAAIIRLRFGIGCEREHTLEEIGQSYGVTRERIRQIEDKALQRLQRQPSAKRLRTFR